MEDFTPQEDLEIHERHINDLHSRASDADYDSLITNVSDFDRTYLRFRIPLGRAILPHIRLVDSGVPIECLRENEDGFWYSMHRVEFGEGLLYVFYMPEGTLTHSIYIEKALYRVDFDSIEVGNNISAVEEIDPVTTQWILEATEGSLQTFNAYHLLRDGLLVISYEKNANDSYEVSAMEFHEDFIRTDSNTGMTFDFSIREQDFPR